MATIRRFEDLEIWKQARILYKEILKVVKKIRDRHDFRFADQMKAAAGSIMDNIAEGFERNSRLEFINSLGISKGECGELRSQLFRALDENYLEEKEFENYYNQATTVSNNLGGFIKYLNASYIKGLKFKDRTKS